ncbi:RING finger and WD repeat domain-containing protein 3 [Dermatophagoides farinae]|uniref:RING-type E3 ubiquitin transferase n=1 Tax=Dermatophagoides farinae TaxID=6954 RepID=A0A922HG39_DERFA|nr:RING finger and WD repeat domain-containing protein 3 [Dermatophagoides farinae]
MSYHDDYDSYDLFDFEYEEDEDIISEMSYDSSEDSDETDNADDDDDDDDDWSIEIIEANEMTSNQPSLSPNLSNTSTVNNEASISISNSHVNSNVVANNESNNLLDSNADCCIICSDQYTTSDAHHIVALRCGHLFGKSCIERWLASELRNQRCPTCSRSARCCEIIKIYAQNLRPLDTWKLDESNKKVEYYKEQAEQMGAKLKKAEEYNQQLNAEIDYLKSKLINNHDKSGGKVDINRFKPPDRLTMSSNSKKRLKTFQISHLKDIIFPESGSRYFCYSHISDHLVVNIFNSDSAFNAMFPRYGVRMFNLESNTNESLFLHTKAMKGMVVNPSEGTLVTISLDKTMKQSSIFNKAVIDNIQLSNEPWSVAKMPGNNLFCVGYRNSIIDVYDRRHSSEPIFTFTPSAAENPTPVASMTVIEYSHNHQRKTALLSMHLDSFWLYLSKDNLITNNYECFKLPMQGKTLSCDFDKKSGYTMISFRPSQKHHRTTHYILDLEYDDQTSNIVPHIINILESGNQQVHLSQCRIFTNPNDEDSVLICAPDDSAQGVMIWDYENRFTQPIRTNMINYDFGLIPRHHSSPSGLLSCLGEKMIKLYKM